jgi:hypothetical protein
VIDGVTLAEYEDSAENEIAFKKTVAVEIGFDAAYYESLVKVLTIILLVMAFQFVIKSVFSHSSDYFCA